MKTTTNTKTLLLVAMVALGSLVSNVGGSCKLAKLAVARPTVVTTEG